MANSIFDVHINVLQVIENELTRLHKDLGNMDGDEDVTQRQISDLHTELSRLSQVLSEKETT